MSVYVFGLLIDADVAWMAQAGVRRTFQAREIRIEEGQPAELVILLLQGECVVTERAAGQIARLGAGEIVGEMSSRFLRHPRQPSLPSATDSPSSSTRTRLLAS